MNKFLLSLVAILTMCVGASGQSSIKNLYQLLDVKGARLATDGQSLVWSDVDNKWIPASVGSSAAAGGSNGQI